MSASTKLSNSVKALCYLARCPEAQSSSTISYHTGINASKIRKLLSSLAGFGIVTTTQGAAGGFVLAKSPVEINLQEIYCAIEDRKAFHLDVTRTSMEISSPTAKIDDYFLDLFSDIQVEIEDKMKRISLAAIIDAVSNSTVPDF